MPARGTSFIRDFHTEGYAVAAITTWSVGRG